MKKVVNLDFCTSVWDGGAQYGIKFFVAQVILATDLCRSVKTDLHRSA